MIRLIVAIMVILSLPGAAFAQWQRYWEDSEITAAFKHQSFGKFRDYPSVWVRWHYRSSDQKYGGMLLHFMANCEEHRLLEITSIPYDHNGRDLEASRHHDAPIDYPVEKDTLNGATYKLLCH